MKSVYDYLPAINATTAVDMAEQAGLDFTAIKVDTYYKVVEPTPPQEIMSVEFFPKTREVYIPKTVAVIREDDGRYLGTVGRTRGILQYKDVLAFTEALVTEGRATYVSGGAIGNGEQAFVVMKTDDCIVLSDGDTVECFFYITTSHDGTKGLEIVFAPLRTTNGTVVTRGKQTRINFKHTSRIEERFKRATFSVDRITNYFKEMETSFQLLRSVRPTRDQLDVYLKSLIPDSPEVPKRAENARADILSIYNNGAACQLPATKGTMLGAYFAVVEWVDKQRIIKKSKVRPNEYDAAIHSLLEGSGAQEKSDAYAFALDLINKLGNVTLVSSLI